MFTKGATLPFDHALDGYATSVQAIAIEGFGGIDVLKAVDLPEPKVPPDAVLIDVRAAGVNPVDYKVRQGALAERFPCFFPLVPGWDVAGVVREVGPAVRGMAPGDEVIAYCRKDFIQEGTYAELVSVRASQAAGKPPSLSFEAAAALPLAGLTAYQAIYDHLELKPGQTILVQRAAGGVGSFAVQLARIVGAHAIATASAQNHDYLRELGAVECVDYRQQDVVQAVRSTHAQGIDAVFDMLGGEPLAQSIQLLRPGGRVVSIIEPPDAQAFTEREVETSYLFVLPNGDELRALGGLAETGELRVNLSETLPLDDAARAHELLEEGHVRGKIALRVS